MDNYTPFLGRSRNVDSLRELRRQIMYNMAIGEVVGYGDWRVYRQCGAKFVLVNLRTAYSRALGTPSWRAQHSPRIANQIVAVITAQEESYVCESA